VGLTGGEGFRPKGGLSRLRWRMDGRTYLVSHGLEMWALAQHYRITRTTSGSAVAGFPLQAMVDGFDWVAAQRGRHEGVRREAGPALGPAPRGRRSRLVRWQYGLQRRILHIRDGRGREASQRDQAPARRGNGQGARRLSQVPAGSVRRGADRARKLPIADGTSIPMFLRDPYELDWPSSIGPTRCWARCAWGLGEAGTPTTNSPTRPSRSWKPVFRREKILHRMRPNCADENWKDVADRAADRHYLWRHYVEYETMWPTGYHTFWHATISAVL